MFKVHVYCIAFVNVAIYIAYYYIGTTCGVLLVFQFQHLRKQQMLLAHSKVIN